jgi:hypothetical protein
MRRKKPAPLGLASSGSQTFDCLERFNTGIAAEVMPTAPVVIRTIRALIILASCPFASYAWRVNVWSSSFYHYSSASWD